MESASDQTKSVIHALQWVLKKAQGEARPMEDARALLTKGSLVHTCLRSDLLLV